jgi:hypothetical protein
MDQSAQLNDKDKYLASFMGGMDFLGTLPMLFR